MTMRSFHTRRVSCWRCAFILFVAVFALAASAASAALPRLGLQTWTCRNLTFDEMVEFAAEHGLHRIQLYRTHVNPADTPEINAAKLARLRERGITPYAMYAAGGLDPAADRAVFKLARSFGMEFLVMEPKDPAKWPELLSLGREFGVRVAVHNHGLETPYGDPSTVRTLLEQYPELGVCLDVGWITAAGFDAAEVFRSYGDRVVDLHFKDKRVSIEDGKRVADDTFPGEGDVNFEGLFKAIRESGWSGTMAIETDSKLFARDPRELVQRSKAFFRARLTGAGMSLDFDYTVPSYALPEQLPAGFDGEDAREIINGFRTLVEAVRMFEQESGDPTAADVADVRIYANQVLWALRFEAQLRPADVVLLRQAVAEGLRRADALKSGQRPWRQEKGCVLRGHRSRIDGSAQPYGVVVPQSYDGRRPMRLDVVLHGSMAQTGAAMLRFADWFQHPRGGWHAEGGDAIEVYPLGRVTNGYRWAGETDVFEVIEAVCRDYAVDRDRIVLRGFSMGASGTWHLGLRNPDVFVALAPYTGYVDTRFFSEGPSANLIRMGTLPEHEERVLPTIDAVSYAANAAMVPVVAAIGRGDPGFRNHEFMADAFSREGMQLVNLIAPGEGHRVEPVAFRKQLELIRPHVENGLEHAPRHLRFVTHTLRYPRCHWIELLGLERHDRRSEVIGDVEGETIVLSALENITGFALIRSRLPPNVTQVRIHGQDDFPLPEAGQEGPSARWVFVKGAGGWSRVEAGSLPPGKRPGLQGPIDDAFTGPFLCVRGTGSPWNSATAAWADRELRRFAYTWNRYWVGQLPVKDDRDVTAEDLRTRNLVLFGDPGSNSLLARVLPSLPFTWTRERLAIGDAEYASVNYAPVLIHPNPIPGAEGRYVVVNSGHTFGEDALSTVAYLLYPRRGDWAVVNIRAGAGDVTRQAGFFDEQWNPVGSGSPQAGGPASVIPL